MPRWDGTSRANHAFTGYIERPEVVIAAISSTAHATLETAVHPLRVPTGCQRPHDLRPLEPNPWQYCARQAATALAVGQFEYAAIERGLLEGRCRALLERIVDISVAQAQPPRDPE